MQREGAHWYSRKFRRHLLDMHITDIDPSFFSKLSADTYVDRLKTSGVQSAMVYSQSHVGLCNWPSPLGEMHKGLEGRDFLGELIAQCHEADIAVVVYYSLMYDNWYYERHPEARIVGADGLGTRGNYKVDPASGGRYGVCCPNNMEYREFTRVQVLDLLARYKFEGMYFDMLFWPRMCHCDACQARFKAETGMTLPATDTPDWSSPVWWQVKAKVNDWMYEYAAFITGVVKGVNPDISVQNQFALAVQHWARGIDHRYPSSNDYVGADLYGGIDQESFICKFFSEVSPNLPFEFQTSRCDPNLSYHTASKSKDYLRLHNFLALAHNGATLFIDAIDPDGSIQPELYRTMGEVFGESKVFEPYIGGKLKADVAVYFSFDSKVDLDNPNAKSDSYPHLNAALRACTALRHKHIPHKVVSRVNLADDWDFGVLVLPAVCLLEDEEAERILRFVREGGRLYVSGHVRNAKFLAALGLEYAGVTTERFTYIAQTEAGMAWLPGVSRDVPLTTRGPQPRVVSDGTPEVLAYTVLPYTDPADRGHFASIHSNPPGRSADNPAAVRKAIGKGEALWLGYAVEGEHPQINEEVFQTMIGRLLGRAPTIQTDAPPIVELVALDQSDQGRLVLSFVNQQEVFPQVPVRDICVRVSGFPVRSVTLAGAGESPEVTPCEGGVEFTLPMLEMFELAVIDYR